ncbi:DUF2523 family protein [Pseudoxanthomonas sp. PXM04]|uniref:DUF2523 family protein n=1 Tax=Pseudoxanthomonas sp. PXM04 TaxID=2769297 RepID=UPI001CE04BDE|nr:DUF2523 family protein [Pseudoxanthomonas sp. PXM04]
MAALSRLVGTRVGQWVLAGLAFLGLNLVTQEFVVGPMLNYVQTSLAGAPGDLVALMGYLRIDQYVTIVMSAYATAASGKALKLRKKAA